MGKLGKMIGASMMSGDSSDAGDDEKKEGEESEPAQLAMRAFRDAFNGGDIDDAIEAFKNLCDVTMDY